MSWFFAAAGGDAGDAAAQEEKSGASPLVVPPAMIELDKDEVDVDNFLLFHYIKTNTCALNS